MPPEFVLFLDENHCNNRHLRATLDAANVHYEPFLNHFTAGTPDAEWLPFVGANGWALLTTDKRIRYRELERQAVQAHLVRMFYFSSNNMSGRDMAAAVQKALRAMIRHVEKQPPPFFAAITRTGEVILRAAYGSPAPPHSVL